MSTAEEPAARRAVSDEPPRGQRGAGRRAYRSVADLPPRLVMLLAFGVVSVMNYGFGLVAGHLLTPGDFGLLAFAQSSLLIGGLVLQSGVPWSLTRSTVGAGAGRRAVLVRGALVANVGLAVGLSLLVVAGFAAGPLESGFEEAGVAWLVAASLPFFAVLAVARAAAQGREDFGVNASLQLLEVGAKVAAGLALAVGFGAAGAVAGFPIGAGIAAAVAVAYISRRLAVSMAGARELPSLGAAAPMFGALLALALLINQDLLAVKLLSGDDRTVAGYYQAAIILANAPYFLATSTLIPVLFTRLARTDEVERSAGSVGETLATVAVFVLPLEAVLVLAPELVLELAFPEEYGAAAAVLRLMAIGNSLAIVAAILSAAFQAMGRASVAARRLLVLVLLEAAALAAVVPSWKVMGAVTIFAVTCGAAMVSLGVTYARWLDPEAVPAARRWLVRYGAAATVGIVAGVAGGRIEPLLGVAVGGGAYVAASTLLGTLHGPWHAMMGRPFPIAPLSGERRE